MNRIYQYAFYVQRNQLGPFINRANENDSSGGCRVTLIEKMWDLDYLVIVERTDFYPYIISQLEEYGRLAK